MKKRSLLLIWIALIVFFAYGDAPETIRPAVPERPTVPPVVDRLRDGLFLATAPDDSFAVVSFEDGEAIVEGTIAPTETLHGRVLLCHRAVDIVDEWRVVGEWQRATVSLTTTGETVTWSEPRKTIDTYVRDGVLDVDALFDHCLANEDDKRAGE